jgi:SNF2-related domain/Helicase conserved C-terminal domain
MACVLRRGEALQDAAWSAATGLIRDSVPGALITADTVRISWHRFLSLALSLRDQFLRFNVAMTYERQALELMRRFAEDRKRLATPQIPSQISGTQLAAMLAERGFTKRRLTGKQVECVLHLMNLPHGANFSVPGAGKTTVAIAVHLLACSVGTPLLVVAPKNAFVAWEEALEECLAVEELSDPPLQRLTGGSDNVDYLLTREPEYSAISYDQLTRSEGVIAAHLMRRPTHVIVDESHRMKAGVASARGAALLSLAHLARRRDVLSGTPIPQALHDIVPQMEFLWPGQHVGQRLTTEHSARRALRGLFVRTTKEQLHLPPVLREFRAVPMSEPQLALYAVVRDQTLARLRSIRSAASLEAARRSVLRLLQVSSNPRLAVKGMIDGGNHVDAKLQAVFDAVNEEDASLKVLAACDMAEALATVGRKVVIWSSFVDTVEEISKRLLHLGAVFIHGGVPAGSELDEGTRESNLARFHLDKHCHVLVANPAAGGEGISLHRVCHNAIYVDRTYNAAHYLQSVDRIHRLGLAEGEVTHISILESSVPAGMGAIDYSVRRRVATKVQRMSRILDDEDLRALALEEEDADAPFQLDMSMEDVLDIIEELSGPHNQSAT